MERNEQRTKPFLSPPTLAVCYAAAAALWLYLSPRFFGVAADPKKLQSILEIGGAAAILLFGVHHVLLRTIFAG
ncbi:MAG: hypothetical protein LBC63_01475, partial [Holophagales bacterium]|nr:hypothetical protein [Holophagales bacterium]